MHLGSNNYKRKVYKTGRVYGVGPLAVRYLVIILIAIFSLFYLTQQTEGASKRVEARGQDKTINNLNQDYSALEVNASRAQALSNLNTYVGGTKLAPVDKVDTSLITPTATQVSQ